MKRISMLIACTMAFISASAIELPEIIGDNMVLQQQTQAKLWGWADAGNNVKVTTSWNNKSYTAKVGKDGKWMVSVSTPKASFEKYSIEFQEVSNGSNGSKGSKVVNGVLVGEVWFCSGQSNMEMPLGGFWNCPVEGANEFVAQAGKYSSSVRVVTIPKVAALEPQQKVAGKWEVANPENAPKFSACAYFFATMLEDVLQVPVGVINCSWGGSCVEGWMPKEVLMTYPDGLTPMDDADWHRKMVMYNGMLYPLAGYTVKGFLWNQGESNVGREKEYIDRFQTMTKLWRKMWNQPGDKLSMYTVELPPYWYDNVNGTAGADFRKAQHTIAHQLENSGCVCTSDLIKPYEAEQIHGSMKQPIGERLALLALTRDYGVKGIVSEAPEFEYWDELDASKEQKTVVAGTPVCGPDVKGKILHMYFTNCSDGFDHLSDIQNFEAQDADGKWYKATVWASVNYDKSRREGCYLGLACPEAKEIKNVRYCYKNFVKGNLHNLRGLPVVPFTTEK